MMKKVTLFCALALCTLGGVVAQDIHFSQFYMSPLNLNPALTGVMNCNVRLTANYRNQWASIVRSGVYNTFSASYDQRFTAGRYDYFGLGATAWGDQAGSANFGTKTFKVSGSYAKRLAGSRSTSHYLSFGLEGGIAQRSLDFLELRWGNQYDGEGGFDPTIDPLEPGFDNTSFLFADAAAGLLWFSNFGKGANLYAGASYHHLNRANQSFSSGGTDLIYSRFTLHAGGELPLTNNVAIVPGVITMLQGPSVEVNSGASVKFMFGNNRFNQQAFHLGVWTRIGNRVNEGPVADAVILQTRFDYNEYTIGFSYDVNVSELRAGSNGQGGFELALQYKFCGRESRGVYCPNF